MSTRNEKNTKKSKEKKSKIFIYTNRMKKKKATNDRL